MTSDFGGWLAQVPVMDLIFRVMVIVTVVWMTLLTLSRLVPHNMNRENKEDIFEGYEVDQKIKTFKRNCQALKMFVGMHYNLNIRGFEARIRAKYPIDFIQAIMQSTVHFIAEMKARNMNYVLKMKEMEFPLLIDVIEEEEIPDEMEVEDAVALIMLLKANLGLYTRDLLYGPSICPTYVGRRIEDVKQKIKPLSQMIMMVLEVDDDSASKNMINMLRVGKLMLLFNELEQLEHFMRERTQEFMHLLRRRPRPAEFMHLLWRRPRPAQAQEAFQRPPNPPAQAEPSNPRARAGRANTQARAARANAPARAERANFPD